MARISVTPQQLDGQARALSAVPGRLNGARASLAGAAGAAGETPAAGELDNAIRCWTRAIGLNSAATADLTVALVAAAAAYISADRLNARGGG
ncbi:MAG: hypothetical protein Q8O56_05240 [Solirubrobacteraceae bacterium]|nr:hypothetical protein [Solirubrobacteraceae bacterium]